VSKRLPVVGVTATIGNIELRHFPASDRGGEDGAMPEAVLGRCVVTFHFGQLQRSKTLRSAYRWRTPLGWPRTTPVTESEIQSANYWVTNNLLEQIERHGIERRDPIPVDLSEDHQ
jgi:hypothetical protein